MIPKNAILTVRICSVVNFFCTFILSCLVWASSSKVLPFSGQQFAVVWITFMILAVTGYQGYNLFVGSIDKDNLRTVCEDYVDFCCMSVSIFVSFHKNLFLMRQKIK